MTGPRSFLGGTPARSRQGVPWRGWGTQIWTLLEYPSRPGMGYPFSLDRAGDGVLDMWRAYASCVDCDFIKCGHTGKYEEGNQY